MKQYFDMVIAPLNDDLGKKMGINHITVRQVPSETYIKYVRAINPFGEKVFVTEENMRKCETLGLSMRRVHDE